MFKTLKDTKHNVNVNVNVDSSRFFKPVVKTVLQIAAIHVVAHAAITLVDQKFPTNN